MCASREHLRELTYVKWTSFCEIEGNNTLSPTKGTPAWMLSPTRNLNCLFGKIRIYRWLYEPSESLGLSCLFPLELQLGKVAGVATPA